MGSSINSNAPATPELVFDMLFAYQRTAALHAAIALDLFRAIGEGPGDVTDLAKRCRASERGIRILCDFLTICGLLHKKGLRYRHTPVSEMYLDPRSPTSLASTATFMGERQMREPYDHLAEIVRTGHTTLAGEGSVEPNNPIWVTFAESMAPMMSPIAGPLAGLVLAQTSGPMRVLDIAAGHGLFGIEIAKRNPQARVTALDWVHVLDVAEANARKAGVADRFERLMGSAFDVAFGGPYDAVLLTNFLHHFDAPTNVRLLRKVHAALKPGGGAYTLEFVPNEDRVSPPMPAAFSLIMLASTHSGDAYTLEELSAMYTEAGFNTIASHPISHSPHTVISGKA